LETLSESGLKEELLIGHLKLLNIIIQAKQDIKTNLGEKIIDLIIYKYMIKDIEEYKANKNIPDTYNTLMDAESDSKFKEMLTTKNFYNYESKSTIFSIILNLVTDNRTNLEKLLNTKFTSLTDYISKANVKRGYNPTSERRETEGYIGLRNPSCICYMNSILQQFFNIPTFRHGIIQALDNLPPKYSDGNPEVDDNILHQLQKMFVFLEYSTRGEYRPLELYITLGNDSKPTNISIQKTVKNF
jgi:hypothetical protein